jgi:hypothetical protein
MRHSDARLLFGTNSNKPPAPILVKKLLLLLIAAGILERKHLMISANIDGASNEYDLALGLTTFGPDGNTLQPCVSTDAVLATLPAELGCDLDAMPIDVANGVFASRVVSAKSTCKLWCSFCASINVDLGLSQFQDLLPMLYTFAHRWRDGQLAPKGKPVRARTAEDARRSVGQAFPNWGPLTHT